MLPVLHFIERSKTGFFLSFWAKRRISFPTSHIYRGGAEERGGGVVKCRI